MANPIRARLNGLQFSAAELRQQHPTWSQAFIEDYLSILDSLLLLSDSVDEKNNIIKIVSVVTAADSPYEIREADEDVFFDTTDGPITANLRPGEDGLNYRLINVGLAHNRVTLNPFGTEKLFGVNESEFIADQEALLITYESGYGWS